MSNIAPGRFITNLTFREKRGRYINLPLEIIIVLIRIIVKYAVPLLSLARLVVRIRAGFVIGSINNILDFGEMFLDHSLDSVLQGNICHATPLAAAAHVDIDGIIGNVQQINLPAVRRNRRINPFINELLNRLGFGVIPSGCGSGYQS